MTDFLPIKKIGSNLEDISTDGAQYKILHSYTIPSGTLTTEGDSMSVTFNGSFSNTEGSSINLTENISNVQVCFFNITSFPSGYFKIETQFSRSAPEELKCQSTITVNDSVSFSTINIHFKPLEDFKVEILGSEVGENASLTCEASSLYLTKAQPVDPLDIIYLTATLPTNITQFPETDLPVIFNQGYGIMNGDDFYAAIPTLDGVTPIFGQFTYSTFPVLEQIEIQYGINWLTIPPSFKLPE